MKYHPELVKKIMDNIRIGLNQDDAAELSGLSAAQFYEWRKSKPDFAEKLRLAHLSRKQRNLAIISKAALTHWQAAAWDLERRYRAEFASWYKIEHSGPGGGSIPVRAISADFGKMSFEDLEKMERKMDAYLRKKAEEPDNAPG